MGVDDHIRDHSLYREWEILLSISHTASTLLSVTTGKFVANLGYFYSSHFNFNKLFIAVIRSEDYLIDVAFFRVFQRL